MEHRKTYALEGIMTTYTYATVEDYLADVSCADCGVGHVDVSECDVCGVRDCTVEYFGCDVDRNVCEDCRPSHYGCRECDPDYHRDLDRGW